MPDPKLTPAAKPEPITLTIVIEYEDGEYYARIAGSDIFGDGKTPAPALASLAAAYCAMEGYESEVVLRRFAKAAKDEQREKAAALLEQANAGYAALREREQKAKPRRRPRRGGGVVSAGGGSGVLHLPSDLPETDFGNIGSDREK